MSFYTVIKKKKRCPTPSDGLYRVAAVYDGDTVGIKVNGRMVRCRLAGIDAPELRQPHGKEARKALMYRCLNKVLYFSFSGTGVYYRAICDVYDEHVNIAVYLITEGHVWVYRKYCPTERLHYWLRYQAVARKTGQGLWADGDAIQPRIYRKFVKLCR